MKNIIFCIVFLISRVAFGATTVPVQLISPTGSTTGQVITSTGASSAPAWGSISLSVLPAISANSLLGNPSGSSASPSAVAVPSCSASGNALNWIAGTGLSCATNHAVTSGTLAQFASTTSAQLAGVLSDETGTGVSVFGTSPTIGTPTINQPVINGVTAGTAAAAGQVGQIITATSGAVSLTTATIANITSITLTAGDWDVRGSINLTSSGGSFSGLSAGMNTTSLTFPPIPFYASSSATMPSGGVFAAALPPQQYNISTGATIFCVAEALFAAGTATATCSLSARRVH